jgi:hypothetical protein
MTVARRRSGITPVTAFFDGDHAKGAAMAAFAAAADMFFCLLMTRSRRRRSNCSALRDFLFDHLVGAQQDRLRHRKAKRLGGLGV